MKIGIDLDEVVADSIIGIVKFHNERHGTNFKKEDFHSYVLEETFGVTYEEMRKELDAFFATDQLKNIDPMAGSIKALAELKKNGHELYIITGRGGSDIDRTEVWLEHHFPKVFADVHYAHFMSGEGKRKKKSDICKALSVTTLIDDNMDNAVECAEAGIRVILFDQPWNQGELPKNIERVFSWDEIVQKLNHK